MTMHELKDEHKAFFSDTILACPLRKDTTSFQLVDETGDGKPYAGLQYEATDYEDIVYTGTLDATGTGKVENHYCGPLMIKLSASYRGYEKPYERLMNRPSYPLPITELQVRAENTQLVLQNGKRTLDNPARQNADDGAFYQVEVRDFVENTAHLPERIASQFPVKWHVFKLFRKETLKHNARPYARKFVEKPTEKEIVGIPLLANKHHVLEVRPLRALRPIISTDNSFCALNCYQLALFATLSYTQFNQNPNKLPITVPSVTFPINPSSGNWFGSGLSKFDELWRVDEKQDHAYYPLFEDVPYSKRLEVMPFDPLLYSYNSPELGAEQEHPEKLHFLDDRNIDNPTDTQAYITHNDEVVLIAVRGTNELPDFGRDVDAMQVPFDEGAGKVHRGFYDAAKVAFQFVSDYLDKFYSGQKLVITGHSLGGAITLLLSEMLRTTPDAEYDILLYTFGSPRAGDTAFVESAQALVHHRTVNYHDPVPSVPAPWMKFSGDPYDHHGQLHFFMPVNFGNSERSLILWSPTCSELLDAGCTPELQAKWGLPERPSFIEQAINFADHKMVISYIPNVWAAFRRWQEAFDNDRQFITSREFNVVSKYLEDTKVQLRDKISQVDFRQNAYSKNMEDARLINQYMLELKELDVTKKRLTLLASSKASAEDVYGTYANTTTLADDVLPRWLAHAQNNANEQLAMAPAEEQTIASIIGGHTIGASYTLDVDSLI